MKKIALLIFISLLVVSFFLIFILRGKPQTENQRNAPESFGFIEKPEPDVVDIRKKTMPDGSTVEYGTYHGPLSPDRQKELEKIIEEESSKKSRTNPFAVYAAGAVDDLVIEQQADPSDTLDQTIRRLFMNRVLLWTERDMGKLRKIIITPEQIDGALGVYDFAKTTYPDGSFEDWLGIIYVWRSGPVEVTTIHEYGHHYTNYWAAHRTNGQWTDWPVTQTGDYYQMRPLPEPCHCDSFTDSCPYGIRTWEILAEDYRTVSTAFNGGHIFVDSDCQDGVQKVGLPDSNRTFAYLQSLPLSAGISPPVVATIDPSSNITPWTTMAPNVTPTITPTPRPTLSALANFCYQNGGVCAQQIDCRAGLGSSFSIDENCPAPFEGCCIYPPASSLKPTITVCEQTGGICTNVASCTNAGGTSAESNGCPGTCCKLQNVPENYANMDYNEIIAKFRDGSLNPIAVSLWLNNACRVPGMQIVTCNPFNGECNHIPCTSESYYDLHTDPDLLEKENL